MLHEFIEIHRDEIIPRCRAKVATRSVPPPTEAELDHGVPLFLDQLVDALRSGGRTAEPEITKSAVRTGATCCFRDSPWRRSSTTTATSASP